MDEREFELLNILGKELDSNQRDLSQKMDLSLGMVNMLIRRLITKGYIRIIQLNKRKVQYLLTPQGFSEKMRKSVKYTINTINHIGMIKDNVKEVILNLYKEGIREFYVYSESDLTILIEKAFHELKLPDGHISVLNTLPSEGINGVLLIGKENVGLDQLNGNRFVDLITEISRNHTFIGAKA
ncbi:MAG TPA: winged helix-turn-helix transcriptional regulator [Candidatus Omnitrophota bacterium]|nr:winged helix-turn-helix transcriptional regulator [Candidatus Omnitrophota bacterium]